MVGIPRFVTAPKHFESTPMVTPISLKIQQFSKENGAVRTFIIQDLNL